MSEECLRTSISETHNVLLALTCRGLAFNDSAALGSDHACVRELAGFGCMETEYHVTVVMYRLRRQDLGNPDPWGITHENLT